jgi:phosphatidate cytidylyltransferase
VGELKKRILVGLCVGPVIIVVFSFLPQPWLFIFLSLVSLGAVVEMVAMAGIGQRFLLAAIIMLSLVPLYLRSFHALLLWLFFAPAAWVFIRLIQGGAQEEGINRQILTGASLLFMGAAFVTVPLFHLYLLKGNGPWIPLIFLLTLWASDTGAYFFGKNFGKRPLVPRISPKKTFEGLLGAVVGGMVVTLVSGGIMGITVAESLLVGAVMGILGQLGDILESAGKRVCNVKDSSHLIPGHGGILDRIDSFIFTSPFLYYYLTGMKGWV